MPFNLLKKYPEFLELNGMGEKERIKSLRSVFDRDISDNTNFSFRGKRIYPIKTDGVIDMDREFMHLTTEEVEHVEEDNVKIKKRVYDPLRSERLHWLRTHIEEKVKDSNIVVFGITERNQRKHIDVERVYIYNKTRKYIIVLQPQTRNGNSYYLLTAYYLNKSYGEKQIKKKLKSESCRLL